MIDEYKGKMLCPDCQNFLTTRAIGGEAIQHCSTCKYQRKEPRLIIHVSKYGIIPTRPEGTEINITEEEAMRAAELAGDPTLYMPPNSFCPKCGSPLKVDMKRNKMYTFICPRCRIIVTPVSKPPGFKVKE